MTTMNNNANNTRVIVIGNDYVIEEEWNEIINKEQSFHLAMIQKIIAKMYKDGLINENLSGNDIANMGTNLARIINGIVLQVFPNGDKENEIALAVYYDNHDLSNSVYNKFLEVYNCLLRGLTISDKSLKYNPQNITGVLLVSEPDFSDCVNVEKMDTEESLATEEFIDFLPFDFIKGRKN